MRTLLTRPLAATLLASSSFASTWIVDDSGGPGVQFTDIGSAIAVAAPGDVILVRPGTYAGFTLQSGVLVLGDANVQVTSNITIANVGIGPRATIARMTTRDVVVTNCAGRVTLEDILARLPLDVPAPTWNAVVKVDSCIDVRLRAVDAAFAFGSHTAGLPAMRVDDSRVEITHSNLRGQNGGVGVTWSGYPGGDGLGIFGASDVHVGLSTVLGGDGGVTFDDGNCFQCFGGNGGAGIRTAGGVARLLVTGGVANVVRGGMPGSGIDCAHDGQAGPGIVVSPGSAARLSGASIVGSPDLCGGQAPAVSGASTSPVPADPTLEVTGTIAQGQPVTYTVRGAPGSSVRLRLGRQPVVQDLIDVYEDRLTVPLRTYDLGVMPPSGQVSFGFTLSGGLAQGFLIVAQASTISSSGVTLTQSVPITLH